MANNFNNIEETGILKDYYPSNTTETDKRKAMMNALKSKRKKLYQTKFNKIPEEDLKEIV